MHFSFSFPFFSFSLEGFKLASLDLGFSRFFFFSSSFKFLDLGFPFDKFKTPTDILEIISYYKSDPFTLINLQLPVNSYRIACTKNQNFEEGENCASTISVEHNFGSDLYSDMIICGSGFKIQELSVFLITSFINFGVTNQAPQVSFNFVVEDSMLVLSYEFDDIRFFLIIGYFWRNIILWSSIIHSPKSQVFSTFGHMLIPSQN